MTRKEQGLRQATKVAFRCGLIAGLLVGVLAMVILLIVVKAIKPAHGMACETNRQSQIANRKLKRLLDAGSPSARRHATTRPTGRVSLRPPRPVFSCETASVEPAWRKLEYSILDAIWQIETECGRNLKRGDGGLAAGHIQQHEAHWIRGCQYLGVNWPWPGDTNDRAKCYEVARANWYRDHLVYVIAGDADELIRRFRRPFDPYGPGNDDYVRLVKAAINQPQRPQRAQR